MPMVRARWWEPRLGVGVVEAQLRSLVRPRRRQGHQGKALEEHNQISTTPQAKDGYQSAPDETSLAGG